MASHPIGTAEEHTTARLALLAAEKEHTRRGDELAWQRRQLPWVQVGKTYTFDTDSGPKTLAELFNGRSQLLVYHFMFGPGWTEGCPICSYWADSFDGAIVHLNQRDVTLVCASRAPLERLAAYQRRMGWSFRWVSTGHTDFNYDFGVSVPAVPAGTSQADMPRGETGQAEGRIYNFTKPAWAAEMPGLSAFALNEGVVYHTYSCYARGLDAFQVAHQLLDLAPRGRDEDDLPFPVAWLRRHDEYDQPATTR